jgi:serine/threonine protein kinase
VQAQGLADFLLPMLEPSPDKRATAQRMLEHPWLRGELPQVAGGSGRRGSRSRGRSRSRSRSLGGHKKSRY